MAEFAPAAGACEGQVVLVEDDAAVRQSLALLLHLHGYRTSAFDSAEAFLADPTPLARPACVLLDIRLPGMSGLALHARMERDRRGPPVLLMTAQGDDTIARTALLQGAIDFLEKPIDEAALLSAVAQALRADAQRQAHERERDAVLEQLARLTRHERTLFERITSGRAVRDIAEEFGLSVDKLDAERTQLMEKLQAKRVADLMRLRFRVGEALSAREQAP